jgi:hypothetical protein
MKSDFETILAIGAIAAGGYLVYKLAKPLTETAYQVGGGIGTAFTGAGTGIGTASIGAGTAVQEVLTGTSSPFEYIDSYLQGRQATDSAREKVLTDLYTYNKELQNQLLAQLKSKEGSNLNKDLTTETKTEDIKNLAIFTTNTTNQSLANNYNETVARKTEYGATPGQYLAKMFLPIQDVAQERRQAVIVPVKKAGYIIKENIQAIFKPKKPVVVPTKKK